MFRGRLIQSRCDPGSSRESPVLATSGAFVVCQWNLPIASGLQRSRGHWQLRVEFKVNLRPKFRGNPGFREIPVWRCKVRVAASIPRVALAGPRWLAACPGPGRGPAGECARPQNWGSLACHLGREGHSTKLLRQVGLNFAQLESATPQ